MGRQIVPDPAGEYSVETGTGHIHKFERDPAKRNAYVELNADHLQRPIKGWLDTHDLDLLARLEERRTDGGRLAYRIDVRRSSDVAADVPWGEVPQTSRFRRLVGVAHPDRLIDLMPAMAAAAAAPAAQNATTAAPAPPVAPPAAEPYNHADRASVPRCPVCGAPTSEGGPVRRTPRGYVHVTPCLEAPFDDTGEGDGFRVVPVEDQPPAPAAGLAATAGTSERWLSDAGRQATDQRHNGGRLEGGHCDICDADYADRASHEASPVHQGKARQHAQADELAQRRTAAQRDASTFAGEHPAVRTPPPVPIPARNSGPRVAEGKPWERYNSDGSLNMGSYAVTASLSMVELAQRLAVARLRDIAGETGEQPHLDLAQVRALARYLLQAADRCQAAVRDDGHIDRMDNSHTRARGAVRMALNVYPVPWGAEPDVRAQWIEDLAAHAAFLVQLAVELDK